MSERIRYRIASQNLWESIQTFDHATNGASYKVLLAKGNDTYKYQVVETGSELIAASGLNVNLQQLKKEARKALAQLGVELSRGTRERKSSQKEQTDLSKNSEELVSNR